MKVNIVFDGPPANTSGRFVEVEDEQGNSVQVGEWLPYPKRSVYIDGKLTDWWVLQIEVPESEVQR